MCTSVSVISEDGTHVMGRTMDWYDLYVKPMYIPREYQWKSAFDNKKYTNKYAIVGGGFQDNNYIDLSDGVNECGLMAQKLTFSNGAQLVDDKHDDKIQLEAYEFVTYILGNFSSVTEVEENIEKIELMSNVINNTKHGGSELHFSLSDESGRNIVVEPSQHPMRIIDNPLGVVTNMPKFERQLAKLENYMEFTDEFKENSIKYGKFHVTTGKLGGKKTPPGSYSPSQRFIRASYLKELVDKPKTRDEAASLAFGILDTVSIPKSKAHRPTYTVYRAVTVSEDRTYYYQANGQATVSGIKLDEELMQNTEPIVFNVSNIWNPQMLS
ncbi:choloylglycine hydrolase family protein [Ligilactobacillus sp. MP3]|uniref:Choloylglycine hydrolase family protein n=1 Tax=Ligilactobacillus salivarius TaxID=1624 RepID=A0A6N9INK1_9LACO|nr:MULTISPECIES: choloylglycine hydrolase family protein [Ligilactobacillus]MCQ4116166.1 choloylglycine hydrolase family protein [Ligilactobacillus sp. MP3]MYY63928.1 choloylglycine hydrolase family protein [Ligilactobacillus salivarius]